jgi:hypothetical protein
MSFEEAVENLDDRVLGTIREFVELLRSNNAAFRLAAGELTQSLTSALLSGPRSELASPRCTKR